MVGYFHGLVLKEKTSVSKLMAGKLKIGQYVKLSCLLLIWFNPKSRQFVYLTFNYRSLKIRKNRSAG